MEQKARYDLTSGPILGRLLLVAVPIMGTQLLQMFYNLADMFWLGRVGADAVAASGTAGMYLWLSGAFMMVGRIGAEIGVSQKLGQRDEAAARHYAQNALHIAVALGVAFAAVMVALQRPLIGFFNIQDPAVAGDAARYLAITALGIPATFISGAVAGIFNASGNSRTPFYINAAGLVVNIALDPVLIFTAGMGIAGAAWATSLAQNLVAILSLVAIKASKGRPFPKFRLLVKTDFASVKQIVRWALPVAIENMLFTFLSMIISRFVAAFGTDAMAVQRVGSQVESLSWLIGGGFSTAVTAFVGQNFGARKWARVRKGYSISLRAMIAWGVIITLILYFAGGAIFSLFIPDAPIVEMGRTYMRILAVCQIVACLEYTSTGAFRGIGKTIPPAIASVGGNLIRLPIVYFLMQTSLGLDGIWWGISIGAILRSLFVFLWFLLSASKLPREDEASVPEA